jgi:hypothetical protein
VLNVKVNGIRKLQQDLKAETKAQKKALATAIKGEGFRQLRVLRDEIRKGTPGGKRYAAELSKIASRTKTGRLRKNQMPLYRLARLLRYNVVYRGGDIQLAFGFTDSRSAKLSTSWKKMVLKHQEGAAVLYGGSRTDLGRRLARIGGRLKKKGDPDAKFFFLRHTTGRRIDLPERPMIDPFWDAHKSEAGTNIAKNFRLKMAGKRI